VVDEYIVGNYLDKDEDKVDDSPAGRTEHEFDEAEAERKKQGLPS